MLPCPLSSATPAAQTRRARWLGFAALCCLLLAGCGFHLRGSLGEFESIPATYVEGGDPAAFELKQFLRTGGADVVEERTLARLVVTIARVQRDRRVLSVGTRGRVQEYELLYRITYHADDRAGRRVIDDQTITQARNFSFDEGDVIAKGNEEDFLFREMQRQAVMQIMRHLQVLDLPPLDGSGDDAPPAEAGG